MPGADPIDIYVGTQVRTRRRKLGMSQVELGARIGVTFQQVQKYENANNRISASALMRIADALEIAAAELLPDGPQVQPDDEYVAMFARETANRGLVAAWGKLEADQREQIQNLVLGLAQKNAGVRRRRPPGQR